MQDRLQGGNDEKKRHREHRGYPRRDSLSSQSEARRGCATHPRCSHPGSSWFARWCLLQDRLQGEKTEKNSGARAHTHPGLQKRGRVILSCVRECAGVCAGHFICFCRAVQPGSGAVACKTKVVCARAPNAPKLYNRQILYIVKYNTAV